MENTYKTEIKYAGDEMFVGTSASGHAQVIDTKGDKKTAASPVELLLLAVGSCTAIDVVSILEKKRQIVTDYKVEVTGTRRDEHPRSFTKINIHHIVTGVLFRKSGRRCHRAFRHEILLGPATVKPTAKIRQV